MREEKDFLEAEEVGSRPSVAWSSVVGAAFGLGWIAIWARFGFLWAILAAVVAIVGGFIGRFYVGESL